MDKIQKLKQEKQYEQYVKESYDVMAAFLEGPSTKILSYCNDPMCRKYAWMHTNLKKRHRTAVFYKSFEEEKYAYSQYDCIRVRGNSRRIWRNVRYRISSKCSGLL